MTTEEQEQEAPSIPPLPGEDEQEAPPEAPPAPDSEPDGED